MMQTATTLFKKSTHTKISMKKHVLYQENFMEPYQQEQFALNSHWLLPQALAFIGSQLPLAKLANGKLSFATTIQLWKQQPMPQLDSGQQVNLLWIKHLFQMLNCAPRGKILYKQKQATVLGSRYAANVPLILSAFKEYRNVSYSMWDFTEPEHKLFMDKDTAELVDYFGVEQPWSREQLLEFQELGRMVLTGANAGRVKSVIATTSITNVPDAEFKKLPRLMKTMLCQTWVYTPEIRNKYAITNLIDLDKPAEPLVDAEVFVASTTRSPQLKTLDEMWL